MSSSSLISGSNAWLPCFASPPLRAQFHPPGVRFFFCTQIAATQHSCQQCSSIGLKEEKRMGTHSLQWISSDPSQLFANRLEKSETGYWDCVHGTTTETLSFDSWCNKSSWVEAEMVSFKQGTPSLQEFREDCGARSRKWLRVSGTDSLGPSVNFGALSKSYDEGQLNEALQSANYLDQQGVLVSIGVFYKLIQLCIHEKDLASGRQIHCLVVKCGFQLDTFLASHLIRMFALSGSLLEADQVFNKLSEPNAFSWNAIISAHTKLGQFEKAIILYHQMKKSNVKPDAHILVSVLKACSNIASLDQGRQIHTHIIESGFEMDPVVCSALIDMYVKCRSLRDAGTMFDKRLIRNVLTWNVLMAGYTRHGNSDDALNIFKEMQQEGIHPDQVTFMCILKACSNIAALEEGRQIHAHIIRSGIELDAPVGNTLINMYVKCGILEDGCILFKKLLQRDVVTWCVLIAGYTQQGHGLEALHLFQEMQEEGLKPDQVILACILKACSMIAALDQGSKIHTLILEGGFELDAYIGSALVDMYVKCGRLEDASRVFSGLPNRNVVSWNTLISGYVQQGVGGDALQLLEQMPKDGIKPDWVTYVCGLKACSSIASLELGLLIHKDIVNSMLELDICVGNTLIDMYAKCGSLKDAQLMFDKLPKRDVVTWNAMISGYVQHEYGQEALLLFQHMQQEGVEPAPVTFVCTLKACSSIAALEQGKHIHTLIIQSMFEPNVYVGSALIDMYAKCGSLDDARTVFNILPKHNIVTWSALIAGYAQHNDYFSAYQNFKDLQTRELTPDNVTFLCLLSACSHVGLLDEGCMHFKSMREDFGMEPTLEHYNTLVDLLGHASYWAEAQDLLETIPYKSNSVGWTSLLSSCRTHGIVELGRQCFQRVITMDHGYSAAYVLMSNIYACSGMLKDARKVEELRISAKGWKKPAKAFIEVGNKVHNFTVGDKVHPRYDDIHAKLKSLTVQMREEGYETCSDANLNALSFDDKESALCGHCEKLAIAFGLICTPRGTTIRVAKSLRMCADCHITTKLISKMEMREIIIIDSYCVHHFQCGACSCKDYY